MRLIDLENPAHVYCGEYGDYENWNIAPDVPTIDAVPVSFIEELKVWAKENGSAEYANDLTHLLSVWAERKEE